MRPVWRPAAHTGRVQNQADYLLESYRVQGTAVLQAATATRYTVAAPISAGLYLVLCQTADGQLYSRRVTVE